MPAHLLGVFGLDVPPRAGRDSWRERRRQGPDAAGAGATRPHRHDPAVGQGTAKFYVTAALLVSTRRSEENSPPTSRKRPRKAPPAPRPKRRRKTKAAPVEPVLSEYELGRRAKIKRNNKFLVSVGLLFPPQEALEDDEHPWWYMTAR